MATALAASVDRHRAAFEARERRGAPGPAWLGARRREAIDRVVARGLPTTRDEDWRYTSLEALGAVEWAEPPAGAADRVPAEAVERLALAPDWPRLVFVDGRFSPRHSSPGTLPGGVRLASLAEVLATDPALVEGHLGRHAGADAGVFAGLNTAFVEDGAVLAVAADVALPAPVELMFLTVTPGALAQPRVLVLAGPGSRVGVVERHVGLTGEPVFANVVTEVAADRGAAVDHHAVQAQGAAAFHLATVAASLARDATLATCAVTLGGRLARTSLGVRFDGEGGRAALSGLYVLDGRQHVDHHVTVDHAVPRCASRQLYKGVLDGAARAVFDGRILVRRDAQKTDATQTNKHLLLSDGVEVDSKPRLEIFADDVRCTHGAAEGQLAPEALFYLRSRGLGEAAARALLVHGFAREVLAEIAPAPLRAHVEAALAARLGRAPGEGRP